MTVEDQHQNGNNRLGKTSYRRKEEHGRKVKRMSFGKTDRDA
jgi:stalled ribosome alternative rescue factor ArfA